MSKQKKSKKERRPNIYPAVNVDVVKGLGSSVEQPTAAAVERKTTNTLFDYTHVKNDLTRIGILAASFITILVVLSLFLNR